MRKLVLAIGTALSVAAAESLDELTDSRGGGITPWVVGYPGEVFSVGGTQTGVTVRRVAEITIRKAEREWFKWVLADEVSGRRVVLDGLQHNWWMWRDCHWGYYDPLLRKKMCDRWTAQEAGVDEAYVHRVVYKLSPDLWVILYHWVFTVIDESGDYGWHEWEVYFYYPKEDDNFFDAVVVSEYRDRNGVNLKEARIAFYVREPEGHSRVVKARLGNSPSVEGKNRVYKLKLGAGQ